jgi:hypothetical protein
MLVTKKAAQKFPATRPEIGSLKEQFDSLHFLKDPNTVAKCSDDMKKITTSPKANRRPARERKNPSGVQNQLSVRRSNTGSKKRAEKPTMNTTLEQPITEATEPTLTETPKNPKADFTRGQLEKAKRAFAKAGHPDASEQVRKEWLAEMSTAGVAVMEFSSSRLAKILNGKVIVTELRRPEM